MAALHHHDVCDADAAHHDGQGHGVAVQKVVVLLVGPLGARDGRVDVAVADVGDGLVEHRLVGDLRAHHAGKARVVLGKVAQMVGDVAVRGVHDHDGVAQCRGGLLDEVLQALVGEVRHQQPPDDGRELLGFEECRLQRVVAGEEVGARGQPEQVDVGLLHEALRRVRAVDHDAAELLRLWDLVGQQFAVGEVEHVATRVAACVARQEGDVVDVAGGIRERDRVDRSLRQASKQFVESHSRPPMGKVPPDALCPVH